MADDLMIREKSFVMKFSQYSDQNPPDTPPTTKPEVPNPKPESPGEQPAGPEIPQSSS
jgi:hypothetical protein